MRNTLRGHGHTVEIGAIGAEGLPKNLTERDQMSNPKSGRAEEALGQAAAIAESLIYLSDSALSAGPDFESGAYFTAIRALGEKLQREVEGVAAPTQ